MHNEGHINLYAVCVLRTSAQVLHRIPLHFARLHNRELQRFVLKEKVKSTPVPIEINFSTVYTDGDTCCRGSHKRFKSPADQREQNSIERASLLPSPLKYSSAHSVGTVCNLCGSYKSNHKHKHTKTEATQIRCFAVWSRDHRFGQGTPSALCSRTSPHISHSFLVFPHSDTPRCKPPNCKHISQHPSTSHPRYTA